MLIDNNDTAEEAANAARLALPWIRQQDLSVSPVNYAVAYEYISNRNTDLHKTADQQLEKHKKLSQNFINALYVKFLSRETSQDTVGVETVRSDLHNIFSDTLLTISESSQEMSLYKEKLTSANHQLSSYKSIDSVQDIIHGVITETSRIQNVNSHFQNELQTTCGQLTSLHAEFQRMQNEAIEDPLTGVLNRRGLNRFLEKMIKEKTTDDLSLLMIDIDHFKHFNDTFGHLVGDEILRYIARTFKDNLKGKDIVARYGGEEFIILLAKTELDNAMRVAQSICQAVRSDNLKQKSTGKKLGKVTISIGLASHLSGESPKDLINRADKALYAAKASGRDRVVCYSEELTWDS